MGLAIDLRRQARVCARLAEDCEDEHLAERLKAMARDLVAKADELDEPVQNKAAEPMRWASQA